jgi:hypothetical protein
MPNMQRLTWQGIALHAGHLPGYPASHGCIRLPVRFSELLFTVTQYGSPVIIADQASPHSSALQAGLILPDAIAKSADTAKSNANSSKKTKGPASEEPVTSILVSAADRKAYLMTDGISRPRGRSARVLCLTKCRLALRRQDGRSNRMPPISACVGLPRVL